MRITITNAGRELAAVETLGISRQLQLALSRFQGLVSAAHVVVGDPAEANASVQLRLRLRTGSSVSICERNADPTAAARTAAQRAASVLDRNRNSLRATRTARIQARG
jgi:hypothetical protein